MINDYVKREDVIEAFKDVLDSDFPNISEETPRERIESIPSADAVPKHDVEIIVDEVMRHTKDTLLKDIIPVIVDRWIPCSERLPEDSGDYLVRPSDSVLEDYSDFSEVMIMPYDADCEAFGWWTERYDPISLGYVDSDFNEFDVLAWMPLPDIPKELKNNATN